jgi:hypothetical protein
MRITTQQCTNLGKTAFLLTALFAGLLQPVHAAGSSTLLKLDTGLKGGLLQSSEDECDEDGAAMLPPVPALKAASAQPATKLPTVMIVAQKASEPEQRNWEILPSDKTLNVALARWAAVAGWQLVWELPVDYAVETRATVPGSFQDAVTLVTKSMDNAEIPLKAIFYEGNKVLRIVGKGVE